MSPKIEFTRNYSDLSTDKGFQFEFFCDSCGTGFRTHFQPSALGTVTSVLDAASSLLGGVFGKVADMGERARSVTWERAHDEAFTKAMEELKPDFTQCPRCRSWVCKKGCWNQSKGLCKMCAPDLGVEMAAAQASRTVEEIWAHSKVAAEDREMLKEESWREGLRATCPSCNSPLENNAKFCTECGAKIKAEAHCTQCGAKLAPNAKFCGECGAKRQ
ncbi:MAG TPA: zinc ribbon domain-containing protein [Deltaproteobacteria bacterium]|nr:zinc ribbon domain-containing protein [Deltaproteobacteria bacterium]